MEREQTRLQHKGLGAIVVEDHPLQLNSETTPLVVANFVNPWNLLPDPYGDKYLSGLAIISAGKNETALTFQLLPGFENYLREIGVIDPTTTIIQASHNGGRRYGFPHGDPLHRLHQEVGDSTSLRDPKTGNEYVLVPTLTHGKVAEQARKLGVHTLDQPDADVTNNKAILRDEASRYGIPLLPGIVVRDGDRIGRIVKRYKDSQHGIWLKFPTGSGGDLVQPVERISRRNIRRGIKKVRDTVYEAIKQGDFGIEGKSFWPRHKIAPREFPLVIEEHAKNLGEVLIIGSNHFSTLPQGEEIYGYFKQITGPTGDFIGSERFEPEGEMRMQLDEVTRRVAQYNRDKGFFGVGGIDYFVIQRPDGKMQTFVLESNARPIISTYPYIVGERLGINEWTNTNVTLDRPIRSFEDFVESVGPDLLYQKGATSGIVPMAFRTVIDINEGVIDSPHCKLVILGSEERRKEIMQRLEAKGITIGATI